MDEILKLVRVILYPLIGLFVMAILASVFIYLKRKLSKTYPPPVVFEFLQDRGQVILAIFLITSAFLLLLAERYKFDHIDLGNGESYPVRVSRITGNAQVLYRGVWIPSFDLPKLPLPTQELSAENIGKLVGHGTIDHDVPLFTLSLYNGSPYTLKEITVEVVVLDSSGKDVLTRMYQMEDLQTPAQTKNCYQDLEFYLGPGQTWTWKIVAARAFTP